MTTFLHVAALLVVVVSVLDFKHVVARLMLVVLGLITTTAIVVDSLMEVFLVGLCGAVLLYRAMVVLPHLGSHDYDQESRRYRLRLYWHNIASAVLFVGVGAWAVVRACLAIV